MKGLQCRRKKLSILVGCQTGMGKLDEARRLNSPILVSPHSQLTESVQDGEIRVKRTQTFALQDENKAHDSATSAGMGLLV